ncbi:hypothetical protein C1638_021120 [Chryseobacterium oncorhynchi]|uniref:Uncharacterized protein n=1 Tax=Chryseobacterium oncorhynchi TaxID=741074 RepID=A0A316WDT2_9FLAO|nr:hypothetical protein C1638_021120 [Chryseobacterium oncorhynchi]
MEFILSWSKGRVLLFALQNQRKKALRSAAKLDEKFNFRPIDNLVPRDDFFVIRREIRIPFSFQIPFIDFLSA